MFIFERASRPLGPMNPKSLGSVAATYAYSISRSTWKVESGAPTSARGGAKETAPEILCEQGSLYFRSHEMAGLPEWFPKKRPEIFHLLMIFVMCNKSIYGEGGPFKQILSGNQLKKAFRQRNCLQSTE